ncbi:hypothetical protein SD78_1794 [Bacillus badius]|nr:hypothetical protein SD78_1794 [Bacillus badius]
MLLTRKAIDIKRQGSCEGYPLLWERKIMNLGERLEIAEKKARVKGL